MKTSQRGTAIFMALLIITITAGIAVTLLRYQRIDIKRTNMMLTSEQAYLYTQGVIGWAAVLLRDDALSTTQDLVWPKILEPTNIADGRGKIAGRLEQAEGLLNINNLSTLFTSGKKDSSTTDERTILLSLLSAIDSSRTKDDYQELINAITAWVSPANTGQANAMDTYDEYYSRSPSPYRSPHNPMISISELRAVSGMSAELYERLLPYIVALPSKTSIDEVYSPPLLNIILKQSNPNAGDSSQASSQEKQKHQYFLLRADVYLQDQHFILYTLLKREIDQKNPKGYIIDQLWQSFGTL